MSASEETPTEEEAAQADTSTDGDWKTQRDANKQLGDDAFRSGQFELAIHHYSAALSLDPDYAKVLSNRSAAYLKSGQKSKALHDAQQCVKLGSMGMKGVSRLAAALQSLGRFPAALDEWNKVLKEDPKNAAALKGKEDCQAAAIEKEQQAAETEKAKETTKNDDNVDDLDDFFNDVDNAAAQVALDKQKALEPKATNAIKHSKADLGTAQDQIARLTADNYQWRNLNPFFVLNLPHTATKEDISRRFKALSLLLHPDKNQGLDKAQEAYDQVLKAKEVLLKDDDKASHVRQLVEEGLKIGKADWEESGNNTNSLLESFQSKAVQRLFAQLEYKRREVQERERNYAQREQDHADAALNKERQERKFDKSWRQEERVDKRIGNWRDFAKKKKQKG